MEAKERDFAEAQGRYVRLPAPTAWPLIFAFGIMLSFAGLVMNVGISFLGVVLAISGCVGWFRDVLPHEKHEDVPAEADLTVLATTRATVSRIEIVGATRAYLPVEVYPIRSGLKGGLAGGLMMIFPALLYGIVRQHSIWYPVNLLGGAGVANWTNPNIADIASFHWQGLIVASIIHITTSLLVGLLYGAMLPMLPRHPILLGGVVAPMLWTGLLYSSLEIINPALNAHIEWSWFALSQFAFGLVAGLVVVRSDRIRTTQNLPLAVRMGIETPGLMGSHDEKDKS